MWKKGDKLNPRFRYTTIEEGLWKDEVMYETKNGKTKTIKGKDRLEGENPTRFKWRGDGLPNHEGAPSTGSARTGGCCARAKKPPFALSLSKGRPRLYPALLQEERGFDRLSPNG